MSIFAFFKKPVIKSAMSSKDSENREAILSDKKLEELAAWIRLHGDEAFKKVFENKSEVEKIIEKMSVIDEKSMREPYTI